MADRKARHKRIRKQLIGTAERPRLTVYRSSRHIHAEIVNDILSKPIFGVTTASKEFKSTFGVGGNKQSAEQLGKLLVQECKKRKITKVTFDRSGYKYHGRIKTLAEAVRGSGIEF